MVAKGWRKRQIEMNNRYYVYFTHDEQDGIEPLCEVFVGTSQDDVYDQLFEKYPTAEVDYIEEN